MSNAACPESLTRSKEPRRTAEVRRGTGRWSTAPPGHAWRTSVPPAVPRAGLSPARCPECGSPVRGSAGRDTVPGRRTRRSRGRPGGTDCMGWNPQSGPPGGQGGTVAGQEGLSNGHAARRQLRVRPADPGADGVVTVRPAGRGRRRDRRPAARCRVPGAARPIACPGRGTAAHRGPSGRGTSLGRTWSSPSGVREASRARCGTRGTPWRGGGGAPEPLPADAAARRGRRRCHRLRVMVLCST